MFKYIHLTTVVLVCTTAAVHFVNGQWAAGIWAFLSVLWMIHWYNADKRAEELQEACLRLSATLGGLGLDDLGQKASGN